jgi:hypothetical protein
MTSDAPTPILFGAFDRHNFGDLLFPHVAATLLDAMDPVFAGLAERDMRHCGGHCVRGLANLTKEWGKRPATIMHVGGELLTCDAWEAAVMLLPPREAQEAIARFEARPEERMEWARRQLGLAGLAPYTAPADLFPDTASVTYNGVGGVDLDNIDPAMRAEVVNKLAAAGDVSVRDRQTLARLAAAGINARLIPDPAVMVAELFGTRIRNRPEDSEVGELQQAFPQGYLAVQFSADFGDDDTLPKIAGQLDRLAASTGFGIAFFRAGAAPWHDDLAVYERAAKLMSRPVAKALKICRSLDVWDICAVIASSRGFCGSSLHGRIVAMAFALPRVNLLHAWPTGRVSKQAAYASTWEQDGMPLTVAVDDLADAMQDALAVDHSQMRRTAEALAALYRQDFKPGWRAGG